MAQQQNAGDHRDESCDAVADQDLNEREHVDGLVAPVARLVQELNEMRPPNGERPEITAREPNEQEQTEHGVGEA